MAKKAILFVDDEPKILAALQRMLRLLRNGMNFYFEKSGSAALAFMATHRVDVIVADMQMPGMDGTALLTAVQKQFPLTTRIILTGQVNEGAVLRTVGVAHQFLAKPISAETLRVVLERACALQDLLENDSLKALISRLGTLPSLPSVYAKLQSQLRNSNCSLKDIAATIEQDMAMSTKVLHLVNSAFFGFFNHIDSPAMAVNLLGLDTIKALVLGVGIFTELEPEAGKLFSVESLWNHSLGVAAFAKRITQEETTVKDSIENSFIAGLVHDIGKLIFYSKMHRQYAEVTGMAREHNLEPYQAERRILHTDHAEAGGYLIGLWGLPEPVVEAVTFHHRLRQYPIPSFSPTIAVHCADVIYHRLKPVGENDAPILDFHYMEQAGVDDRFDHWLKICRSMGV